MSTTYDQGDVITLWAVFRDEAGVQTAPTTATFMVLRPGATASQSYPDVPAVAADETRAEVATGETLSGVTGVRKVDLELDTSGLWRYEWLSTGSVAQRQPGWLEVRRRHLSDPPGTVELVAAAATAAFDGTVTNP